jgi:ferredoxin
MSLEVTVDADTCIGTGNCVFNAPGVFDQDENGTARVIDVSGASRESIQFAASTCPVQAIHVAGDGS